MLPDQIAAAVRHHWWLFLLRGIAAVAFGVITLLSPGATLLVLMAFIIRTNSVDGIVALVYAFRDRKSTRLNSSHGYISYAVFCLKKKKNANLTSRAPP